MTQLPPEFENMLASQIPDAPATLRGDIEGVVRKNLKRQMFRDDMKWLGFCFSILFMVVAAQWFAFSGSDAKLKEASSMIAATDAGKKLAQFHSNNFAMGNKFPNQ